MLLILTKSWFQAKKRLWLKPQTPLRASPTKNFILRATDPQNESLRMGYSNKDPQIYL